MKPVYPHIERVADGESRPFWSVMIPTYNCAQYLRQTLESVLARDPGPEAMQIEVLDDASTKDDPAAVVAEVGRGRVAFTRHDANMGLVANFNACLRRARGRWVHLLHGDDYVLPGFYARIAQAIDEHPEIGLVFTRSRVVDEQSRGDALSPRCPAYEAPSNDPSLQFYTNHVYTPSVVVRRDAYEQLGGFTDSVSHTTDWETWTRMIAGCGGMCINEPLACYRVFEGNDSSRLMRNALRIREYWNVAQIFAARYPGYDLVRYRREMADLAWTQRVSWSQRGDVEAVQAHERMLAELSAELGWKYRMRILARRVKWQMRSWFGRVPDSREQTQGDEASSRATNLPCA